MIKIIQSLLLLGLFFVMALLFYKLIVDTRLHRKRMNKLNQWSDFNKQLMEWANEITDSSVKVDFINECAHRAIQYGNDKLDKGMLDDWDIDESKKNICDRWGKYIPSLLQEVREKKLNKIGI